MIPSPDQSAAVRECGDAADLFTQLRRKPELAFVCAALIPNQAQRDQLLRDAFLANPAAARPYLAMVLDRPWFGSAGFFPLFELGMGALRDAPEDGRKVLFLAARRYPGLALREADGYAGLPFGRELLEAAAAAAPDEAVGLAAGKSVTGERVAEALGASAKPDMRVLYKLAREAGGGAIAQRAAVFFRRIASGAMSLDEALRLAAGPGFFSAAAQLRIGASGPEAAVYDRVLETFAEVLMRSGGEMRQLPARDLYLLLAYGRTEEDDKQFGFVFDVLLAPKLRGHKLAAVLDQAHDLHLRRFMATAVAHHRLDAFLNLAGDKPAQAELLARCARGLVEADEPLEETLAVAEILDAVHDPARLGRMEAEIRTGYSAGSEGRVLYGLLAARLARKMGAAASPESSAIAAGYEPYFKEPRELDAAALFNGGLCLQQQFFYDDDDAAESFESFRKIYAGDAAWTWEDRGWYVHLTGTGTGGRRIEIYANVPHAAGQGAGDDRRHALSRLLVDRGLTPTVVVHRGHTWYVDQSIRYLNPAARLVYLGSCRGLVSAAPVMALARSAQIISTRGVGTLTVNDPLLKAINTELLSGAETLDWERFWEAQRLKFRGNAEFRDYVPPPRNAAAILLAAYYQYLAKA